MNIFFRIGLVFTLSAILSTNVLSDELPLQEDTSDVDEEIASVPGGVSVDEARRQAELLHETLHATLHLVHHQLYMEDQGMPIPAAVLKDVFSELEEAQHVKLHWLVVEGQAMNTDHLAQDDFEREAVKAIQARKEPIERIENGVFRRAGAITLSGACLKCHVPDRKNTDNRAAGLVIEIPVAIK